ncbi:MAG: chemotaxis-specific protein-glutamate methyltransferase CheB, partial [Candidatus Riflebacteria bacterium]|nr:chemotaxis-specific protein-glutamate methyltransferase CheB [Candidatus Riflebacteria bacterium]
MSIGPPLPPQPGQDRGHRRIHVLVVDDSAVVRQVVSMMLSREPGVTVETASDCRIALDKIGRRRPDAILLDLDLPGMDGLSFLRKIMAEDPIPVVICSALAQEGTDHALRAMEAGAVEIVAKPKIGVSGFLKESAVLLVDAIRGAAGARLRRPLRPPLPVTPRLNADAVLPPPQGHSSPIGADRIVAIGASTGGPEALQEVLTALPRDCPSLVIVQHMPEPFTEAFARRLGTLCVIEVREARTGDWLQPGLALIARGNRHLIVNRVGNRYQVEVVDGPLVSRHRPSVDVLFRSIARSAGSNA